MRTASVIVTHRCNQACGFCERVRHGATDPPVVAVFGGIRSAIDSGARSIALTGGEPLLRADLEEIVRAARTSGAEQVVLETNATGMSPNRARALATAGLSSVQISLVTSHPERHRQLVSLGPEREVKTRPEHVFRGIRVCLDAGLAVTIRVPIARGLPAAAARIAGLAETFPSLARFVLAPTGSGEATLRPDQALSLEELARELEQAYQMGERVRVEVALAPGRMLPPCSIPVHGAVRRLFAPAFGDRDGELNDASSACGRCALSRRCQVRSQDIAALGGDAAVRPIDDARGWFRPGKSPGSRLHVLGAAEVETFFHVDYEYDTEVEEPTSRIGIIYRCNQVCTFCELADMSTPIEPGKVRAAIAASRERGSRRLIITGGEPTLSPHLVDYVGYARQRGIERIELQTNAVLLDKPGLADTLRRAGLTHAQVSIHGPDSEVSDRLTAAPGTHQRTLGGIDKLLAAGVHVLLNHLVFKDNCHLLGAFVKLVEARWAAHLGLLTLQFHSPRNEFEDRDEALRHIPRYSEYVDALRDAIDRARAAGIDVRDLQDPTGVPSLCVIGADEQYLGPIIAQAMRPRSHHWESEWMTRVQACDRCDAKPACMGVPRHYLALHGDSEFSPIRLEQPVAGAES